MKIGIATNITWFGAPAVRHGVLLPESYRYMPDPFIWLTAAAASTSRLKLGLDICLVPQRNPPVYSYPKPLQQPHPPILIGAGVTAPAEVVGGRYCEDCAVAKVLAKGTGVRPYSIDPRRAALLWEKSAELVRNAQEMQTWRPT
jgi:hypothetical protein